MQMRTFAILFLAAALGWFARGVSREEPHDAVLAPVAATSPAPIVEEPSFSVALMQTPPVPLGGTRNLFAYREAAPVPQPHIERVAVFTPPPVIERPIVAAPPLRFPYRYIGHFGTTRTDVAAFTRDGTVITVRAGDRIDAQWTLRRIGMESVDVEAASGERVTVTVSADV